MNTDFYNLVKFLVIFKMHTKILIITLKIFIEIRDFTRAKGSYQFFLGIFGNY